MVVRGAGPQADRRGGQVAEPFDRAAGLAVGRERQLDQRARPRRRSASSIVLRSCRTSKRTAPRLAPRQTQKGASRQSPCVAEGGDGVVLAPDPVQGPILGQALRCGSAGIGAAGPGDGRRTRGSLRSGRPGSRGPRGWRRPRMPRSRAGPGRAGARAELGLTPAGRPRGQKSSRSGSAMQPPRTCGRPVGERGEERFVVDRQVLVRGFAGPVVELDPDGPEPCSPAICGHADRGRLGDVVVDDQVQPQAAVGPGERGRGEVLDPDAGWNSSG